MTKAAHSYCTCQVPKGKAAELSSYDGRGSFAYRPELDSYVRQYAQVDFAPYFGAATMTTQLDTPNGDLLRTLELMSQLASQGAAFFATHTPNLAKHLKADTAEQSAYHVWRWIKDNITYQLDAPGKEQLRTVNRIWADRFHGVDCDDYAIMAAALLLAMGYQPRFRVVKFAGKDSWSHVYVVLNNYTIDPVMHNFNVEPPRVSERQDHAPQLNAGVVLNGVSSASLHTELRNRFTAAIRAQAPANEQRKLHYLLVIAQDDPDMLPTLVPYIDRNVQDIAQDGTFVYKSGIDPDGAALGFVLLQADEAGLGSLVEPELSPCIGPYKNQLLSGTDEDYMRVVDYLGKAARKQKRQARKEAKQNVKAVRQETRQARKRVRKETKGQPKAVRKTARQQVRQDTRMQRQDARDAVPRTGAGKAIRKVGRTLLKVNPLGVAGRNAYRLLVGLNFRGWASRMNRGLISDQQAAERNIAPDRLARYRQGIEQAKRTWERLGGNWTRLRESIQAGAGKKPVFGQKSGVNGLSQVHAEIDNEYGLGDGGGTAAALTAAAGVVAAFVPIIKMFAGREDGDPEELGDDPLQEMGLPFGLDIIPRSEDFAEQFQQVQGHLTQQLQQSAQQQIQRLPAPLQQAAQPLFDNYSAQDLDVDVLEQDDDLDTQFRAQQQADPAPATAATTKGIGLQRTLLYGSIALGVLGVGYFAYRQFNKPKRR